MFFMNKSGHVSWVVVFLGNPGTKYANSRHNIGFMTADVVAELKNVKINCIKFKALTGICDMGGERALLIKPQTYMNLSGDAVHEAMSYYKIPIEHVLVISDDVSLPTGSLRIRRSGSAGGHNGLKDIIAKCGGDGFPRIKVGVGSPPHPEYDMAEWVLSSFKGQDAIDIADAVKRAAAAAEYIIQYGVDKAMNEFN